ncbi:hypothetical protein SAMN05660772_01838 [Pasteurella testudinis DSM 23072]|uniref:Uncharacterized protein n=1 Tax=Pasteurella testudinis DSM 23072 TaxID=1122938 RepID=A0A1W1UJY4_9PAST|nr:hypothetical protein [Pasteurella testudinis]SMB81406.1 hypothetical protein SAMN05660772_01838 [Pasteurella testudinis DSM 23072]SUB51396.1 Uncharacterised protein [Pasteurella testudinis]
MTTLKNDGDTTARVFGPTGNIVRIAAGETLDVPFSKDDIVFEKGSNISFVEAQKPASRAKKAVSSTTEE